MANDQLTLKLLIDTKSHRVLFAEGGKDEVDFLFSLLVMPVGTIVKLLTKDCMVGSLGHLYESLESLDETYLQTSYCKSFLLGPKVYSTSGSHNPLLPGPADVRRFYKCAKCSGNSYVTDVSETLCPVCGCQMTTEVNHVESCEEINSGYVKGLVTYTVMDDLSVTSKSSVSSITQLNQLQVKDVGALQEKTVNLGLQEGLELLKASLKSKTVLTDVFLGKRHKYIVH